MHQPGLASAETACGVLCARQFVGCRGPYSEDGPASHADEGEEVLESHPWRSERPGDGARVAFPMLDETPELLRPTPLDRYVQGKASCGPLREAGPPPVRVQERHGTVAEDRKDKTR